MQGLRRRIKTTLTDRSDSGGGRRWDRKMKDKATVKMDLECGGRMKIRINHGKPFEGIQVIK